MNVREIRSDDLKGSNSCIDSVPVFVCVSDKDNLPWYLNDYKQDT